MKYYFLLLLPGFISCASAPTEKEKIKVMASYAIIHTQFLGCKAIQQEFVDKSTEAGTRLKADTTAIIDTRELHALLDSARIANKAFRAKLDFDEEPDSTATLKYKAAAVAYTQLLDSLYNKEFPQLLQVLEKNDTGRVSRMIALIPRVKALVAAGDACGEAGDALKAKYNFEIE